MSEQPQPVAVCTQCGSYLRPDQARLIGTPCQCDGPETLCTGTYRTAKSVDWRECSFCSGHGTIGTGARCLVCHGAGWESAYEGAH